MIKYETPYVSNVWGLFIHMLMRRLNVILVLLLLFVVSSCQRQTEHQFIYTFKNTKEATVENVHKVIAVVTTRLDAYGVKALVESYQGDKISVKVYSNELDQERFNKVIVNRGKLEFWETYEAEPFLYYIFDIDEEFEKEDSTSQKSIQDKFVATGYPGGAILGYFKTNDTLGLLKILNANKSKLPQKRRLVKFLYGMPEGERGIPIYTIKWNREDKAALTEVEITEARQGYNYVNSPIVTVQMNKEGASRWERMTGKASREGRQIAIVVNDVVQTAPGVNGGPIKGGRTEISGEYTVDSAREFAAVISSKERIPKLELSKYEKVALK